MFSETKLETEQLKGLWNSECVQYENRASQLSDWPFPEGYLPRPQDRILDAGCGAGTYLGMFRSLSAERYGIDISERMVETANRYGTCQVGDIRNLPYQTHLFDYLLSVHVISHCGNATQALGEMIRVCKPGGRIVLALPNRWSVTALLRTLAETLGTYSLGSCYHLDRTRLQRALAGKNVSITKLELLSRRPVIKSTLRKPIAWLAYGTDILLHQFWQHWGETLLVELTKHG